MARTRCRKNGFGLRSSFAGGGAGGGCSPRGSPCRLAVGWSGSGRCGVGDGCSPRPACPGLAAGAVTAPGASTAVAVRSPVAANVLPSLTGGRGGGAVNLYHDVSWEGRSVPLAPHALAGGAAQHKFQMMACSALKLMYSTDCHL